MPRVKTVGIVLSLAFATAALPQNRGSIAGKVVDLGGNPVQGAKVEATDTGAAAITATTSADGRYNLARLPAGTYRLTIAAPGFGTFSQDDVHVNGGDVVLDVELVDRQFNTLGDGREFFASIVANRHKVTGPVPRLPNGKPDLTGLWFAEDTVDPGKPVVTPWAAAIKKERDQTNGRDFPHSFCLPMGNIGMNTFDVWQVVQTAKLVTIISGVDNPGHRLIYTDGRPRPKDYGPTWYGRSIGYWEGDTLVIDTVGFNDKSWLPDSYPHSEQMHTIERYRRADLGRMEIEFVIEDPVAFKQPWVIKRKADLAPDEEMMEFICNENEKDRAHVAGK